MLPEDIAALEAKGIFEAPEKSILDALVSVFLDRVFPLYPIVNRQEFQQQYQANKVPWILLHAVCLSAQLTAHSQSFIGLALLQENKRGSSTTESPRLSLTMDTKSTSLSSCKVLFSSRSGEVGRTITGTSIPGLALGSRLPRL
jgi:hypothetical protein